MKFNLAEENKNLRSKLTEELEKYNREKKYLSEKIIDLESKVSDLEFINAEQSINLKVLEEELINKNSNKRPDSSSSSRSQNASRQSSCYGLHTASISGINDYISLLAKAKDDVINYKKESSKLLSELELYKRKLSSKNNEIEKLKSELNFLTKLDSSSRKICTCHEVDSCYDSFEDSMSETKSKQRKFMKSSKANKSKCDRVNFDSKEADPEVSDASVQVDDIESIVKKRLDDYIRKAKDIVPDRNEAHIIKTIQEERDYYCREYHRLKDKVIHAFRNPERPPAAECPFSILDQIKSELKWQRNEIDELKTLCKSRKHSSSQYDSVQVRHLEERLKKIESRESELSTINDKLANKVRKLEDQCSDYRERIRTLTKENSQQKSIYNQIRMVQDDSERSLFNVQDALRKCDSELNCALSKIQQLEGENKKLKHNLDIIENEKKCLKKNLVQLDHEKDQVGMKLDEKTELVIRLEKELIEKRKRNSDLENKLGKLEESLKILQNINIKTEENARHAKKSYSSMQQELNDLQRSKESLIAENCRLQDNLSAAVRDCFQSNNELRIAKAEVEELKTRLQSYVSEVRRIEDILQIKEDERRCMLEQLKGLNVEYSSNNSKSRTYDNSDNIVIDSLSDFKERYHGFGDDVHGERS